jgi:histidine triad (HIT) family protein
VFCQIVSGDAPASMVHEWDDAVAFTPLNPVTEGHVLVVPKRHVTDALADPVVAGLTFRAAADYARRNDEDVNLITSAGADATQTVFHLHVHIVPRRADDGLLLPWSAPLPARPVLEAERAEEPKL